ncbi:hypothetical protein PoB_003599600 [Plakobranchus ocellatus]|uniref:Uncharacterized protein n=1 Tax=Plakobranchus ocellatus TaxID=259542 RepID=A0AAV4AE60_9GAST|nr:hypothetical protein PoB_003599600 [Plakobranchus ocellatus]
MSRSRDKRSFQALVRSGHQWRACTRSMQISGPGRYRLCHRSRPNYPWTRRITRSSSQWMLKLTSLGYLQMSVYRACSVVAANCLAGHRRSSDVKHAEEYKATGLRLSLWKEIVRMH